MADNANQRKIDKSLDLLRQRVNDLYNNTYYSSDNSEEFKTQITDKLDDAIRKSTQSDEEFKNISNTSKLFRKLLKNTTSSNSAQAKLDKAFGKGGDDDISSLFQSSDLVASMMESYSKTKWITELDNEFDLICKYMTKLQAALDIKRDAVLCSDSYTKEFLEVHAKGENPQSDKNAAIQNNIAEMIKKYDLSNKAETWYEDTSKYGEEFVYCVPYSSALEQLLKRKQNTSYSITESVTRKEFNKEIKKLPVTVTMEAGDTNEPIIKINFDKSKVLKEAIENNLYLQKAAGNDLLKGLSESFVIHETNDKFEDHFEKSDKTHTTVKLDKTIDDELDWEDDDRSAADGLVSSSKPNTKVRVNGAVLRTIKHDRIIPIYIEDTMFGAYYIRFNQFEDIDINATGNIKGYNSITGMFNNGQVASQTNNNEDVENQKNLLLRTLAGKISQKIDAAFINSNTDLKEEIYKILRFNDKYNQVSHTIDMDVVFVPSDDIHHLKFREDPDTHRGISDLWDALVPAKQWITLTLTSVLGWATRGFDRRVYYVKQSLDTNTAQSLLNVITTIKKGNFGIRQMESVNNILGIVGRFNDFVIPMGPSGDAPIQFDTMPGQQFDFPTDLQSNLEESAVNSTGVPLEIVNSSTGMDFAVRYTMTNAKLLRNVLKRQLKMEDFLSEVFTKIYRFEYDENITLEVQLPPPAFLSMTQGTQLLNSAVQYADSITEVEMAGQSDEGKALFKKRLIRKLIPSYMSDEEIEKIKDQIALDNSIQKSKGEDEFE